MRVWVLCTIIAALLLVPACLRAQDMIIPESMGLGYSLTGGAAFFINNDIKNNVQPIISIAWYGATGDEFGSYSSIGLSGQWIPFKRNDNEDVQMVPVFLNYKVYGYASGYRLFTNLGIGITTITDDIPAMQMRDGINFGWTIGFGIDITNELFGQFRFIASDQPGDDGFATAEIGYRF